MSYDLAEADRMIGNLVSIGTVTAIDNATATARVQIGDLASPPLSVMQIRSGKIRLHWMPSVGEQVSVLAPSGNMSRAFILGSLPITGNAVAPDAGAPTMDLGGGTLRVIGDLYVEGAIRCTGDVTAAGVSLITHTHGGVIPGGSSTEEPN